MPHPIPPLLALPIVLLCALPGWADDEPGLSRSPYPTTSASETGALLCYMETDSGAVFNLQQLCYPNLDLADFEPSDLVASGDRIAIQEGSCYFVDASGQTCSKKTEL